MTKVRENAAGHWSCRKAMWVGEHAEPSKKIGFGLQIGGLPEAKESFTAFIWIDVLSRSAPIAVLVMGR